MMSIQLMFNLVSTFIFLYFAIIWQKSDPFNLFIKITLSIMCMGGLFLVLKNFGYMVRI